MPPLIKRPRGLSAASLTLAAGIGIISGCYIWRFGAVNLPLDQFKMLSFRPIFAEYWLLSMFYEDKKHCLETTDKLWFGILDLGKEMEQVEDIVAVFTTLPHLHKSRVVVLKLLEERAMTHWRQLQTGHVIQILR